MTRGRENIYSIHQNSKQFYRLAIFTKHVAHVGIGLRATGAATLRNLAWPRREEVALVTIILRLDQWGGISPRNCHLGYAEYAQDTPDTQWYMNQEIE